MARCTSSIQRYDPWAVLVKFGFVCSGPWQFVGGRRFIGTTSISERIDTGYQVDYLDLDLELSYGLRGRFPSGEGIIAQLSDFRRCLGDENDLAQLHTFWTQLDCGICVLSHSVAFGCVSCAGDVPVWPCGRCNSVLPESVGRSAWYTIPRLASSYSLSASIDFFCDSYLVDRA